MDRDTIDKRRAIEDRALELAAERVALAGRLAENTAEIVALLNAAIELGIPIEHFARMVGVRRQSLYRWRQLAGQRAPAETS